MVSVCMECLGRSQSSARFPGPGTRILEVQQHNVIPLYISPKARTPDQPEAEPHLRRRLRDASLTAWERAGMLYDREKIQSQETLDEDHHQIYTQALERI